jgi:hypothetical protein
MSTFHKHGISVSQVQVRKLARGEKVRLKHESLHGPHAVYLTKTQHGRLSKAHAAKKGMDLQMSATQIRHHRKVGGSIFDTLKDWGSKAFDFIKPIAGKILTDTVAPRLATKLNGLVDSGLTRLGAGARKRRPVRGRGILSDVLGSIGLGVRKPRPMKRKGMKGEGFFDDLWSGIKSVGSAVAPIATPILTGLVTKKLGLGLRRKKRRGGRGLNPPGY